MSSPRGTAGAFQRETGIAQLAFELVEDRRGGSQPPLNSGQAPAGTAVVRHETPFPVQVLFMRCGFRNSRLHRNDTWPGAYRIEVRL